MDESAGTPRSTVYGPVPSWRFGSSLGIDLLLHTSICSFDCIYCQLGRIQRVTLERKLYVPTERVIDDLTHVDWDKVDVVTISGNGEPTLALNLAEVIAYIKATWRKPVLVLTNSTLLHLPEVRRDLWDADIVSCKLDAWDDASLERMNRPAEGVTFAQITEGIRAMKREGFPGTLALQCMFMPVNINGMRQIADLIGDLAPDEVQLNTPTRPYPRSWFFEARGTHIGQPPVPSSKLKTVSLEEAEELEALVAAAAPGARVVSVYRRAPEDG